MKLSVIVAIYNVQQFVERCAESLIKQLNHDVEIILVNDGSKDDSGKLINRYKNLDNVVIIHQENAGVSVARNTGIEASMGDWVTFVDGDDFVSERYVETILNTIKNNEFDMLFFNYSSIDGNGKVRKLRTIPFYESGDVTSEKDLIQKRMISQYYDGGDPHTIVSSGTCWCKVIKKSLLDTNQIRFVPGLVKAQDTVFWLNASERAKKLFYINDSLYFYRLSNSSISSGKRFIPDSVNLFQKLVYEHTKFIKKFKKDVSFISALNLRINQVILWNIDHNFFNKKNENLLKDRLNELKNLVENTTYKVALKEINDEFLPRRLKFMNRYLKKQKFMQYYYFYQIYSCLTKLKKDRK